ncbi:thioredoxin family protein [Clostridium sp. 19966]|uniref:thioredoxin family protein n=1 Tax=Clostridium sp. 19966 TaxID=2768166 RepID=UPI0028DF4060|nr:thioredoxin family protein [Clostridium sp. 19966]MDT8718756.1 thioredoxin family protein [Clostridium sp. 19966]
MNIISTEDEIDELPSIAGKFSVFALPCILIFLEGKEILREARFISINELEGKIKRFYDLM